MCIELLNAGLFQTGKAVALKIVFLCSFSYEYNVTYFGHTELFFIYKAVCICTALLCIIM